MSPKWACGLLFGCYQFRPLCLGILKNIASPIKRCTSQGSEPLHTLITDPGQTLWLLCEYWFLLFIPSYKTSLSTFLYLLLHLWNGYTAELGYGKTIVFMKDLKFMSFQISHIWACLHFYSGDGAQGHVHTVEMCFYFLFWNGVLLCYLHWLWTRPVDLAVLGFVVLSLLSRWDSRFVPIGPAPKAFLKIFLLRLNLV